MTTRPALLDHAATGVTTMCRLWCLTRRDGQVQGFTDHDRDLVVDGVTYRAATGLSARNLERSTGLAVDNTEALGALIDDTLSETDILAGRIDGAEVTIWLANWADLDARMVIFAGEIGQITRAQGAFQAELRGLAEKLNIPQGRVIQPRCGAHLGDNDCGFNAAAPGFSVTATLTEVLGDGTYVVTAAEAPADGWFAHGLLRSTAPQTAGISAWIREDGLIGTARHLTLWLPPALALSPGDTLELVAGCDKQATTCRVKFSNFINFRGFPHVPGDDWLSSFPVSSQVNNGGSMNG
jgi:uncharacterized phage protein (TIGR02218 family)